MKNPIKIILISCIFLLIFAILFWPTIYRYDDIKVLDNKLVQRTNRLTGESKIITSFGNNDININKLPFEEVAKIEGTASVGYANTFTCDLYNGSNWTIKNVVIKLDLFESSGELRWSRHYCHNLEIKPLMSGSSTISITQGTNFGTFKWEIFEVRGYLSENK